MVHSISFDDTILSDLLLYECLYKVLFFCVVLLWFRGATIMTVKIDDHSCRPTKEPQEKVRVNAYHLQDATKFLWLV